MENTNETQTELTFGQKAVGINFNPAGDPEVNRCKQMFANCIDQMNAFRTSAESHKAKNYAEISMEHAMTSQIWAVKALTWKD